MTNKKSNHLRHKKEKPPIVDGWIELAPGNVVMINKRLSKEWYQEVERIKELRGRIIAGCIQIELMLDSLLQHLFFPEHLLKVDPTKAKVDLKISDLSSMFLYDVIKDLRFSDKCKILKKLSLEHKLLEGKEYKKLLAKLDEVRKIRNLFAHSPITFVPVGDPPNQTLKAEGYIEGRRIILDQEYIDDCEKLFSQTMQLLDTLNREVTQTG